MALTPRQYRSHIDRNRGWPPRSQLEIHQRLCHSTRLATAGTHVPPIRGSPRANNSQGRTHHFSVTCPFWTLFMLKPTVGMELRARQSGPRGTFVPDLGRLRLGTTYSIVNSPPCMTTSASETTIGFLTAIKTHRQYSQERGLARVLEADHGDVHLGVPARRQASALLTSIIVAGSKTMCIKSGEASSSCQKLAATPKKSRTNVDAYQNKLSSQS